MAEQATWTESTYLVSTKKVRDCLKPLSKRDLKSTCVHHQAQLSSLLSVLFYAKTRQRGRAYVQLSRDPIATVKCSPEASAMTAQPTDPKHGTAQLLWFLRPELRVLMLSQAIVELAPRS